jgi:hypothetical protein
MSYLDEALQYLSSLPDDQARLDAIAEDLKNGNKRFDFAPSYGDTDWGGFRDILNLEDHFDAATRAEGYASRLDFTDFFNENDWEGNQEWFQSIVENNPSSLTHEEIFVIQKILSEKGDLSLVRDLIPQEIIDSLTINMAESNGITNLLMYYSFSASDGTELKFTTFATGGGICDPGEISLCSTPYRTIYVPAENDYLLVSTDYLDGRID